MQGGVVIDHLHIGGVLGLHEQGVEFSLALFELVYLLLEFLATLLYSVILFLLGFALCVGDPFLVSFARLTPSPSLG